MYKQLTFATALLAATAAQAVVVTQWNFNSVPSDSDRTTGTTVAAIGAGTASLVGGVTSKTYITGVDSTDLSANNNNSGWPTATYAAQGTGNKTSGVQFMVSTTGFNSITLSWDQRFSNRASKYGVVQYTTDGVSFQDAPTSQFSATAGGDAWTNNLSYDFSSVAGVNNNATFGVRMVSTFAPSSTAYAPAAVSGSTYGTNGTWRFDMVTLSGTAIPPVPEPGTYALLLAGLGVVGFIARRRRG